ncbi:MAG: hypothetical protein ACHRXM_27695 [Isosphaerales bacterium]
MPSDAGVIYVSYGRQPEWEEFHGVAGRGRLREHRQGCIRPARLSLPH